MGKRIGVCNFLEICEAVLEVDSFHDVINMLNLSLLHARSSLFQNRNN